MPVTMPEKLLRKIRENKEESQQKVLLENTWEKCMIIERKCFKNQRDGKYLENCIFSKIVFFLNKIFFTDI